MQKIGLGPGYAKSVVLPHMQNAAPAPTKQHMQKTQREAPAKTAYAKSTIVQEFYAYAKSAKRLNELHMQNLRRSLKVLHMQKQ